MDLKEKIAQRELELHEQYYHKKYGYHRWDELPPLMRQEIYSNAGHFTFIFQTYLEEQLEGLKVMGGEARKLYNFTQQVRATFEVHSWCRQQTKYDSEFIAKLNKDLMTICNMAYELTQLEDVKKQLRREK